ncbi:MAG: dTMP kinase [Candidatus Omnitrophota bacterium]
MTKTLKKGLFITVEGSEGSGKSTQSKMLSDFLKNKGFKVVNFRDPGATKLGEDVRNILLKPGEKLAATSETLLYMAARAQLVYEKILPALKKRKIVICDRFTDATVCYQGYGLGVDIKLIEALNKFVTNSTIPALTLFLDLNIKKGLKRSHNVKGYSDRIEQRSNSFHKKVREGYIAQAKRFPKRIKRIIVDGNSKERTQEIIRALVLECISKKEKLKSKRLKGAQSTVAL